ncbi:hypothetical protein [Metabacillus dongyingensis]|uniref:hypothetical protein n=1 Tax=Metabacillus dongyingensis TaxID=2874282 RepID=UPI001CC08D8F|nr:hypothetical protein [Metabacillus dongyingensis]UAL51394.1 hypothetical protein K8L98_19605 [Metabacillus dongyingensis]
MKKWVQNLLIAFILLLLFFLPVKNVFTSGLKISVENRTGQEISGLEITYYYNEENIPIPSLKQNEQHEITIVPDEDFGESIMQLVYTDQNGKQRQEMIFGYFEKGYRGTAKITAKSADSQGVITFKVEEKLYSF